MKTENSRRAFVYHGLEILKMSVLLVLYEEGTFSTSSGYYRPLAQKKIHQRLGLIGRNYRFVQGILEFLEADGYVEHYSNGKWAITEKGRAIIKGQHAESSTFGNGSSETN